MLKTLWGTRNNVGITMTTVMVIVKQVIHVTEHRFVLQVTTALLSSVPNSVLVFAAEQFLKLLKPVVNGITKQNIYFPVNLLVWSWVVCLPCGLVSSPFPHERSCAKCVSRASYGIINGY